MDKFADMFKESVMKDKFEKAKKTSKETSESIIVSVMDFLYEGFAWMMKWDHSKIIILYVIVLLMALFLVYKFSNFFLDCCLCRMRDYICDCFSRRSRRNRNRYRNSTVY